MNRTKDTHTIHRISGSWHTEDARKAKKKYERKLRREVYLFRLSRLPNKIGMAVFGEERYVKIRNFLKGHE